MCKCGSCESFGAGVESGGTHVGVFICCMMCVGVAWVVLYPIVIWLRVIHNARKVRFGSWESHDDMASAWGFEKG